MTTTRIIHQNAETGITQFWHEHENGDVTLQTQQDITQIAAANRELYNQVDEKAGWKGDMHRVASIPISVYYDLKAKGIVDDPVAMKRWLNDPENQVFRTRPGRV